MIVALSIIILILIVSVLSLFFLNQGGRERARNAASGNAASECGVRGERGVRARDAALRRQPKILPQGTRRRNAASAGSAASARDVASENVGSE